MAVEWYIRRERDEKKKIQNLVFGIKLKPYKKMTHKPFCREYTHFWSPRKKPA